MVGRETGWVRAIYITGINPGAIDGNTVWGNGNINPIAGRPTGDALLRPSPDGQAAGLPYPKSKPNGLV